MAAPDPSPCLSPLCPDCGCGLLIEAVDDDPGPNDRILCRDCGDIGSRQDVIQMIRRKGKSAQHRVADAMARILANHAPRTA